MVTVTILHTFKKPEERFNRICRHMEDTDIFKVKLLERKTIKYWMRLTKKISEQRSQ